MRQKKKDKIIKYAESKKYNTETIGLLAELLEKCRNGIIFSYLPEVHKSIINKLFDGDSGRYNMCYLTLVKGGFVCLKNMDMLIPLWDDDTFFETKYNEPKRHYSRSILKEQESINNILHSIGNSFVLSSHAAGASEQSKVKINSLEGVKVTWDWDRIAGIKVPRTLYSFFTELENKDKNTNMYIDLGYINNVLQINISKEMKRYLCGVLAQCNSNGEIKSYSQSYSISQMMKLFDDKTLVESTCYDVHGKLVKAGILEEKIDEKTKEPYLKVRGVSEGYGHGKNYVVINYAVFQKVFKDMESSAIRIWFEVIFGLNNGEGSDIYGSDGKSKAVLFKLYTTKHDTRADKEKYLLTQLKPAKKRCRSELVNLFFKPKDSKLPRTTLEEFFDISPNPKNKDRGVIDIRIKQKYFVSKKKSDTVLKLKADPLEKYKGKAEFIKKLLDDTPLKYTEEQLKLIVITFKRASNRIITLMIKALEMDYKVRKRNRWKDIENVVKYIRWLYKEYREGDRVVIKNKIDGLTEYDPAAEKYMTYEEPYDEDQEVIA